MELIEIEPGRYRFMRTSTPPARSTLPMPYVISDEMDPTEQVDGRFYTSKAAFRAVGRANGLTEVGNEKMKPKVRSSATSVEREKRRNALKIAAEKYRAGHRVKTSK